ncbi:MAG TPA: DUF6328 family protein [Solirubrobacteraceae bacterium]|nr:DUF6328 family protein [Solirubrobacteraceae bacterium]
MSDQSQPARDGRQETEAEQLDRNTIELLNELRVVGTGIQVIFAFLLVVPFNTGFRHISPFERDVYFITLLCVATSAVLLMSPTAHHRILFRHQQKPYLVRVGNRLAIVAMVLLAISMTGIVTLISDVVLGGITPVVFGGLTAVFVSGIWFGLPWLRRLQEGHGPRDPR